jgi:Tol biopolymer transport system component
MASLYFNRRPIAVPAAPYDIYSVPLTRDGLPREPASPLAELNSPASDFGPEVSSDGREVIFGSGRPGTRGGNDLWVSIRRRVDDPWSTPENLGAPINTALNDRHPSLSADGRTLFFASTRSGTLGSDDLWMATRTRIGHGDR